jgi:CelD/BcsL family acetyltransferase involved in cellulose biosynthesis
MVMLLPVMHVKRRLAVLNMALCMPLSLEGTPLGLAEEPSAGHLHALRSALGDVGALTVHGGAGGSPACDGDCEAGETHTLDLRPGFDALWESSFSSKNRNSCRKAERAGVVVAEETNAEAAQSYRRLYEAATSAWGYDEPPYPPELFGALVDSGAAELWLARLEGRVIAGALLLRGSDDVLYWSGAMDREHQGVAPSNAVIRAAIESSCRRGFSYFDFGASGALTGVERFKTSFGAEARPFRSVTIASRAHRLASRVLALRARGRS